MPERKLALVDDRTKQQREDDRLRELARASPPRVSVLPPTEKVWPAQTEDLKHAMATNRVVSVHWKISRWRRFWRWVGSKVGRYDYR